MRNLIQELGYEYVDQFYKGAIFEHDGKIVRYGRCLDPENVSCHAFPRDSTAPTWRGVIMPANIFTSMDIFAWPKLGYREFAPQSGRKYTFFVALTRSVLRGLREDLLEYRPTPVVRLIPGIQELRQWGSSTAIAQTIFAPKFTPFLEGMERLRSGDESSFALNEDLAVCFSTNQGPGRLFDVLYKENVIGEVLADDTVVIPHKLAKRASSMQLFNGKVRM